MGPGLAVSFSTAGGALAISLPPTAMPVRSPAKATTGNSPVGSGDCKRRLMAQPTDNAGHATGYEIIIAPSRGWLRINWREIWEYRDLLMLLVRRDFLAKYKQTLLGPLWFILQPLLSAVVMSIAFHKVAGIATGPAPPLLFNLCALLPWAYFSQNVTTGAATFTANAHLFGKVYFPRLLVPIGTVVSNLFAFALQGAVFASFFACFALRGAPIHVSAAAILVLPLIAIVAVL